MDSSSEEQLTYNRKLKKAFLDVMFREVDTFYVHCLPDPNLSIGTRGLKGKELKEGIILAFGQYSIRHLDWDDNFLYGEMQFNNWEKVAIPYECITRIFDKTGHIMMNWATLKTKNQKSVKKIESSEKKQTEKKVISQIPKIINKKKEKSKVIQIDFNKKKPRR